jgi:dihydrofolate reductase
MKSKNIVFIARSLDGYIAGKNGELDWLHSVPNPDGIDMGYGDLIKEVDAIVMGRTTYEVVLSFEGEWPYSKHVFVLSTTLKNVPQRLRDKVTILKGKPEEILEEVHNQGCHTLYIDGGRTIQDFMKAELIDELRITTIPILLGGGFPLFGDLNKPLHFNHIKSEVFLDQVVQDLYKKKI